MSKPPETQWELSFSGTAAFIDGAVPRLPVTRIRTCPRKGVVWPIKL
jgi:hypothetical protein